ncbi:MAG: hypothetical protein JXR88_05010 [Clostridia bacterium]|nr:hypothetical protein [Clostridia bacterium]
MRIPKSIFSLLYIIPLIVFVIFFMSNGDELLSELLFKALVTATLAFTLLDLFSRLMRAHQFVIQFSFFDMLGILSAPILLFILAYLSISRMHPATSFPILLLSLSASFKATAAYKKIGISSESIYYDNKVISFEHLESYRIYESQIALMVCKPFLLLEVFQEVVIENTVRNHEQFEELIAFLKSEYREKCHDEQ